MKTRSNFKANASTRMQVYTESQCRELVLAAEEVMWRTGRIFTIPKPLKFCAVPVAGWTASGWIPAYLTERALQTCQKHVVLCNSRTGARELYLEGNNSYFGSGSGTPFTRDPYTNERHRSNNRSIGWAAKVLDALPNIDFAMSLGLVQDVPLLVADRWEFEQQLLNTEKPIVNVCTDQWAQQDCIDMAEAVAGGAEELRRNPFICFYVEPISPGVHCQEALQKVIMGAKKGLPTIFTPCIMAGGTAPATLAGVVVQGLCESLSGLVLSQCTQEGTPYIMGGVYTILDMNSTIFSYGAPELSLQLAGLADVAHFLNLPMFGTAGCTDAKIIDEQAGVEAALSIAMTNMAGPNLNHDIGYSEYGSTSNMDLVVLADEVVGMARRLTAGIPVNEETLSLECIEAIGPGGRFDAVNAAVNDDDDDEDDYSPKQPHKNFEPSIVSRAARELWQKGGSKTLTQIANEKVRTSSNTMNPRRCRKTLWPRCGISWKMPSATCPAKTDRGFRFQFFEAVPLKNLRMFLLFVLVPERWDSGREWADHSEMAGLFPSLFPEVRFIIR